MNSKSELGSGVEGNALITRSISGVKHRHYSLVELLKNVTQNDAQTLNAVTEWAREGMAAGREII